MSSQPNGSGSMPWIFIPVELQVREFQAKLLLAMVAAREGFASVVGHSLELAKLLPDLPPGVFVDKSLTGNRIEAHRRLKAAGHRVVAWCEEGLVILDQADYRARRVHPDCLAGLDLVFAWGESQAKLIRAVDPSVGPRLIPVGNPRADLLCEPYRRTLSAAAARLRERHGKFLLVNTNFGFCNHYKGGNYALETLQRQGKLATPERVEFFRRWAEFKRELMNAFIAACRTVARALPSWKVLIRPHPSESSTIYQRAFARFSNIRVESEGSVHPWLLAAEAVLHNGCTTGIEAALLGRPVFAYCPVRDSAFDCEFPNRVSVAVTTPEELVAHLESLDAGGVFHPPPDAGEALAAHLASWGGSPSVFRILEAIKNLAPRPYQVPKAILAPRNGARRIGDFLQRTLVPSYRKRKFPGVSAAEVDAMAQELSHADPALRTLAIRAVGRNLFFITP